MALLFIILLSVFAVILYNYFLNITYREADNPDEIHFVTTGDNVRITLHRYLPRGEDMHGEPVFFCHGLGANKYNLDFDERYSLARFFSKRGFDSWVISLRGAEVWSTKALRSRVDWKFNFDTFVEQDIRCAIDYILIKTGREKLHWVGHSMGGMLLYAYIIRWGNERIKSGVTLGSPVKFGSVDRHVRFIAGADFFLNNFKKLRLDIIAKFFAPLTGLFLTRVITHQMNPANVDFSLIRRAQFNAVTPLSTALLKQFKEWIEKNEFTSSDKRLNYREDLGKINIPLLVVAGRKDKMARIDDVKYASDKISSPDKKYVELSRDNGFSADYGHIDMVFGRRAREEVFPIIFDWIFRHRG